MLVFEAHSFGTDVRTMTSQALSTRLENREMPAVLGALIVLFLSPSLLFRKNVSVFQQSLCQGVRVASFACSHAEP